VYNKLFISICFSVLMACSEQSAWTTVSVYQYRVTSFEQIDSDCEPPESLTPRTHFQIRKVMGSENSRASNGVVQFQFYWCNNFNSCDTRDHNLQIIQLKTDPENARSGYFYGAKCHIVRHSESGEKILVQLDEYDSSVMTAKDCEDGSRAVLAARFECSPFIEIRGERVRSERNDSQEYMRHPRQ
jgi:hypothetical protein